MTGFIEGVTRIQASLFPESLDEYINDENPFRLIDVFVGDLYLVKFGLKTFPQLNMFTDSIVAIDGNKFKAVNSTKIITHQKKYNFI